ncbi:hypothetical protein Kpol_505p13 [Vanderwaltozyma polyspora DSM 70294]|uniref:Maf-like protein n=1 Tax=Vanderwaltozyma polyspora (strain ATCC 22028 / DSM 70294 / BCRC 21397 / CBS 2163 / NBRC 10782 / NRRL Y-8283 / UCD 57-17) TaxID=436907 RepID=A7TNA4_VANPO|nr:uncharacterized protein Kpol_505p13 [Vanderwaltozyma polyspora DSM 70294]EDO16236.1 hypothetical protein Kpol_505p13 [Vanderwaltozyma polyspora DSM 70294]
MSNSNLINRICSEYEVILASSSPRRYEILHDVIGIKDLKVMKPDFEEDLDKSNYVNDPIRYVCDTSYGKAESIVRSLKNKSDEVNKKKLIVCADTVIIDTKNKIYEKPQEKEVQLKNLKKFCYEEEYIKVVTSVNIVKWIDADRYDFEPFYEETKIYFDKNTPLELIEDYVGSEDGLEVAGGFKIQEISGAMIRGIEGDYYNVVGLPLNRTLTRLISKLDISSSVII